MPNIKLPDGKKIPFTKKIDGFEIAKKISKSLAKEACVISVDGELKDLNFSITKDVNVKIITSKDKEGLEVIRHDAAHVLAMAVQELFPGTQVTIGPVIQDGFYYDFARKEPFTNEDLKKIENKMKEIVDRDDLTKREVWERDKAIAHFKKIGEKYKAEIIESIPANDDALIAFIVARDDYKNRAHLLAWLIHNEVLEIKFAFLKDFYPYPNFQEGEEGYVGAQYHTKDGYFKFDDGDIVAFSGTFNETDTGINRNIEKMNCFRSWVPEDQTRLLSTIADVDSDWMGVDNDALIVEPVTKKTLKKVKTIAPSKRPHGKRVKKKKRSTVKSNMPEIEIPKYINYKEGKWSYQGKAVKAWMENDSRGVLAMATGTGKTITSLIALSHLLVKQRTLLVVISVPSQALLKQWKKESEDFSIRPLVYERSGREKKLKNLGLLLKKQKINIYQA